MKSVDYGTTGLQDYGWDEGTKGRLIVVPESCSPVVQNKRDTAGGIP